MFRSLFISGSILVALNAALYQLWLKDVLESFGVGRVIRNIEEFPYKCRRIEHSKLDACEDLWLDDDARVLYAACAGVEQRLGWNSATGRLNQSSRRPGSSGLFALDIDNSGADGLFNVYGIKPVDYVGATGDDSLDVLGFDAEVIDATTIHLYLINERPPVDHQLNPIDATKTGVNFTVDIFVHKRGERHMKHLRTVFSPDVYSPNNVAAVGKGAFVLSNDHSRRVGFRKELDPILGGGYVAYCSSTGTCHRATRSTIKFANGLVRGGDGLIYVPSSVDGKVRVYRLDQRTKMLVQIHTIKLRMPLDNLAVDADGDMWVPGAPDAWKLLDWIADPLEKKSPNTILKIESIGGWSKGLASTNHGRTEYKVNKMLEDGESKIVSGITTVRHDVKTGRLFMGSVFNAGLVVCEPR